MLRACLSILVFLLPFPAFATDAQFGLSAEKVEDLRLLEDLTELKIQLDGLPDFRFVRDPRSVPPRLAVSGTVTDVPIPLHPDLAQRMEGASLPPLIATLHDVTTGAPLQSCTAPCSLQRADGEPAFLLLYRFGGEIMFLDLPTQHDYLPTLLARMAHTFNAADMEAEYAKCRAKGEIKRSGSLSAEAEPCFSVPPPTPPSARRSGHCTVGFDVAADGALENVSAKSCTEALFCEPSARTVEVWHYVPRVELRAFVPQAGLETTVQWLLVDQHNTRLPEPDTPPVSCG